MPLPPGNKQKRGTFSDRSLGDKVFIQHASVLVIYPRVMELVGRGERKGRREKATRKSYPRQKKKGISQREQWSVPVCSPPPSPPSSLASRLTTGPYRPCAVDYSTRHGRLGELEKERPKPSPLKPPSDGDGAGVAKPSPPSLE